MARNKKDSFISNGLSIEETRVSALVLGFLLSMLYCGYCLYKFQDIPTSLVNITMALATAISAVNVANTWKPKE